MLSLAFCPAAFGRDELNADHSSKPRGNLVLHVEEVGAQLVETLGPKMRPRLRVDELSVDADATADALHAAFHDIPHAERAPDLPRIYRLALVAES
jgi:hypothetical protein